MVILEERIPLWFCIIDQYSNPIVYRMSHFNYAAKCDQGRKRLHLINKGIELNIQTGYMSIGITSSTTSEEQR